MRAKVKSMEKTYLVLPLKNGESLRLSPQQVKEVDKEDLDTPYLQRMIAQGYLQVTVMEQPKETVRSAKNKKTTKNIKKEED